MEGFRVEIKCECDRALMLVSFNHQRPSFALTLLEIMEIMEWQAGICPGLVNADVAPLTLRPGLKPKQEGGWRLANESGEECFMSEKLDNKPLLNE